MADSTQYTFYFAWCGPNIPWDPSLVRFDESIFDLVVEHAEGQIPTATVEIRNPKVGILNPGRSYWAWITFSRGSACEPQALFYGRLVGIPEEIEANTLKLKFIARPTDYVFQKQRVADTMKVFPNYDPIFFDVTKRDDPDSILEGWSVLYHVDRISPPGGLNPLVTASEILIGEDGTVDFAPKDVFYDSVTTKLLQSPLVAVNVKAEVQWEQEYYGQIYLGQWSYPTLGGDSFVGDWPRTGSEIGGGWYAGVSWAGEIDPSLYTQLTQGQVPQEPEYNYTWTNQSRHHFYGDTMSIEISYKPAPAGFKMIVVEDINIAGIQNPYAEDAYGNPDPINTPAVTKRKWIGYREWALNGKKSVATLGLTYHANRKRSERVEMTLQADVQPILVDPLVIEDTEQITIKSGDLSLPMVNMLNWDSVGMGGSVSLGLIIFPDNPLVPGQTSSQIAVAAGTTGMQEPIFSNVAGETTQDGTVTWASLGDTPPSDGAQDWVRRARVPLGTLLLPKPISGVPNYASVIAPSQLNYPSSGQGVTKYQIFSNGDGGPGDSMKECTAGGLVGGNVGGDTAQFSYFQNPTGAFLYIAVQAGMTSDFHITFNEGVGSQTPDGSVIWQNLGLANLPIGGWAGMTPAATYFPTDRGQQSLQHLFCRGRAKLRKRARAVEVSFDTRFEVGALLSCRMNGAVHDPRLPGGTASGKIVSYKLEAHGDSGEIKASVVLGCSIGKTPLGGAALFTTPITTDPGVPSYVGVAGTNNGYVQRGYQQYYATGTTLTPGEPGWVPPGTLPQQGIPFVPATPQTGTIPDSGGSTFGPAAPPADAPPGTAYSTPPPPPGTPSTPSTVPPPPPDTCPVMDSTWGRGGGDSTGNEIGYTPPTPEPNDDGLTFPLGSGVVLASQWHGVASTVNPINIELVNLDLAKFVHDAMASTKSKVTAPNGSVVSTIDMYDVQIQIQEAVLEKMLDGTGLWYELALPSLTNGPFSNYYAVQTTKLNIPQTIDLSASSSGG